MIININKYLKRINSIKKCKYLITNKKCSSKQYSHKNHQNYTANLPV
jgi:hypothetical protein